MKLKYLYILREKATSQNLVHSTVRVVTSVRVKYYSIVCCMAQNAKANDQ